MTTSSTFALLQTAQQDVEGVALRLFTELDDVKSLLAKLAGSHDGDAPNAWQRVQKDWNTATQKLQEATGAARQSLAEAADNYRGAEKKNVNMWS
jgi:WXG100 family type VII secretion target